MRAFPNRESDYLTTTFLVVFVQLEATVTM